jgi:hypothetical protein
LPGDVLSMEGLGSARELLRAKVLLIDFDVRSELTPLPASASENMTKLDALATQKGGIVERACWNCANARHCL